MKTNVKASYQATTHEGGRADVHQKPEVELERAVASCLLFEDTLYESGNEIAERIASLCDQVSHEKVAALAIKARHDYKLRHVPLWLLAQLAKRRAKTSTVIPQVVSRPDEMGELISLYWKMNGKARCPLSAQLKRGLAATFQKFSPYQLAKWNRDAAVKLRDVMFLTHPKPKDAEQAETWKKLAEKTLEAPDTWEVALSAGQDKKATWERLLREKKLGYMALLMNLRNMEQVDADRSLVEFALRDGAKGSRALPFRFVSACKHAPSYAQALSDAMELAVEGQLDGETAVLIDVSGSMNDSLGRKSTLKRYEAAAALAVLIRGMASRCRIFSYDNHCREVPNIKGLGLLDAVRKRVGGGTMTAKALCHVETKCPQARRIVLITDEQAHDGIHPLWAQYGYIINVAPYKPGLETGGRWVRINGFSERIVDWMQVHEASE